MSHFDKAPPNCVRYLDPVNHNEVSDNIKEVTRRHVMRHLDTYLKIFPNLQLPKSKKINWKAISKEAIRSAFAQGLLPVELSNEFQQGELD